METPANRACARCVTCASNSGAVQVSWMRQLASFSYWLGHTACGRSRSSSRTRASRSCRWVVASSGVMTQSSSPPLASMACWMTGDCRWSTTAMKRSPSSRQMAESASPRLPEVDSTTVASGAVRSPATDRIRLSAVRPFTDRQGEWPSSFRVMVRGMLTISVRTVRTGVTG